MQPKAWEVPPEGVMDLLSPVNPFSVTADWPHPETPSSLELRVELGQQQEPGEVALPR